MLLKHAVPILTEVSIYICVYMQIYIRVFIHLLQREIRLHFGEADAKRHPRGAHRAGTQAHPTKQSKTQLMQPTCQ